MQHDEGCNIDDSIHLNYQNIFIDFLLSQLEYNRTASANLFSFGRAGNYG
jgi:hypothetical protein